MNLYNDSLEELRVRCLEFEPSADEIIRLCQNKLRGFKLKGIWVDSYEKAFNIMESCPQVDFYLNVRNKEPVPPSPPPNKSFKKGKKKTLAKPVPPPQCFKDIYYKIAEIH